MDSSKEVAIIFHISLVTGEIMSVGLETLLYFQPIVSINTPPALVEETTNPVRVPSSDTNFGRRITSLRKLKASLRKRGVDNQ